MEIMHIAQEHNCLYDKIYNLCILTEKGIVIVSLFVYNVTVRVSLRHIAPKGVMH
jgi:hypothetical protein